MKHIATGLIFDRDRKLLIYLRDDKATIPFPNHWDLFGGYVEEGETAEQALVREIREELGIQLESFKKFRDYECNEGDAFPNIKHVFIGYINCNPGELTLDVGQELRSIDLADRHKYRFANILGRIIDDFATIGIHS